MAEIKVNHRAAGGRNNGIRNAPFAQRVNDLYAAFFERRTVFEDVRAHTVGKALPVFRAVQVGKILMQILFLGNKQSGFIMVKTILFIVAFLVFFLLFMGNFSALLNKTIEKEDMLKTEVLQRNELQYKKMEEF